MLTVEAVTFSVFQRKESDTPYIVKLISVAIVTEKKIIKLRPDVNS